MADRFSSATILELLMLLFTATGLLLLTVVKVGLAKLVEEGATLFLAVKLSVLLFKLRADKKDSFDKIENELAE